AFLEVAPVCAVAAIPLAIPLAVIRRRSAARSGRPELSWRITASTTLTLAAMELGILTEQQPRIRATVLTIGGLLIAAACVLGISGLRDLRRQAQLAAGHGPRPLDPGA